MLSYDYLVIGSGLTGAVIARVLVDAGQRVLIVERKSHIGGNIYDYRHPSGINVHAYGPHYFRTNDERIWIFVNRFAQFYEYVPELKSFVNGHFENWPIAASYIRKHIGSRWEPAFNGEPQNFEEASLAMMPRQIYERFVRGYTEKQWGVEASSLSPKLAKRFDIREDDDPRLMRHKYQGIPCNGYTAFITNMLSGIPVLTNVDYMNVRDAFAPGKKLIFTGPIDEFFGFELGRLGYRGQVREHEYIPGVKYMQPCGQVNNPDPANGPHIRTLEWKHMMQKEYRDSISGTLLTREITVTPEDPNNYEYPIPDKANDELYQRYRQKAEQMKEVLICGRLGEYRYYDMDQAIARAMQLAKGMLN